MKKPVVKDQRLWLKRSLDVADYIFKIVAEPDDLISLYKAQKILESAGWFEKLFTRYFSKRSAAKLIYYSVNLGSSLYQSVIATYTMYFTTTFSGVKKLYRIIFTNPVLAFFFFLSFYFRLMTTAESETFNSIVEQFNLPRHEDLAGTKFIHKMVGNVVQKLVPGTSISFPYELFSQVINSAADIVTSPFTVTMIYDWISSLGRSKVLKTQFPAVYISEGDAEQQAELDEWTDYVMMNAKQIRKEVKKSIPGKKKKRLKMQLQQVVERKTDTGDTICLEPCSDKNVTYLNYVCESACGTTFFWQNKPWCWVNLEKNRKGKKLQRALDGRTWDYCDPEKKRPLCFTGLGYKECVKK